MEEIEVEERKEREMRTSGPLDQDLMAVTHND